MKKSVLTGLVAPLTIALSVTLAGCGGSGDDKEGTSAEPSQSTVVASFTKEFTATNAGALDKEEAGCFASAFVEAAGVDRLVEAKLINDEGEVDQEDAVFDEELATQYADAFLGCVDYTAKQAEVIASADKKVDEEKLAACLDEALPNEFVTRFIVSSYLESGDVEALRAQSSRRVEKCRDDSLTK